MSLHRIPVLALAALAVASLAACDDSGSSPATGTPDALGDVPSDDGTDNGTDVPAPAPARLRAIHLSPDAPAVDIFANGGPAAAVTNLAFPQGTGYLELPAGTYDFDIAPAGAGIGSSVLSVADLALEEGKSYTAVAFNVVSSIQALALEDRYDGLADGNIRIRAVHAAAGIGQVDIWALPSGAAPVPLFTDLDFARASDSLDVPAGAYTVGIDVDDDSSPDVIFDLPSLPAGTVATAYAVKQGDAVFLVAQLNDGTTARIDPRAAPAPARVRVVHLSPDAPAVDVHANEGATPAVTGLAFPAGTAYLDVPAGEYNFDIAPAGAGLGASVLDTGKIALEAGKSYTAYAYDAVASLKAGALADDYEDLAGGRIRVRAIHAAAGVGRVDIWNLPADGGAPAPLYTDVDFGAVGAYADLPAGSYRLGFDVNDDATPDLTFTTPDLPAGTVANIFAVQKDGDVFLVAQLNDGATVRIDRDLGPARVRVVHLSPDAPAVDVFANEGATAAVTGLAFGQATAFLDIPAGTYNFDVAPAGAGLAGSVLDTGDLDLSPETSYTAFAYDEVASLKAGAFATDYSAPPEGMIRVRAIHAAAGVGRVDIWNLPAEGDPAPLYTGVDRGAVGAAMELPAGAYTLGFDVNADAMPDLTFALPALPSGAVADVFAVAGGDGVFLWALFQDGTSATILPMSLPRN